MNKGKKRKDRSLEMPRSSLPLPQLARVSRGSSIRRLHQDNRRYISDIPSAAYSTVSLLNNIFLLLVGGPNLTRGSHPDEDRGLSRSC